MSCFKKFKKFKEIDLIKLEKLFDDLRDRSINGAAIIVEGKKDLRALRFLGVEGPIIKASESRADDIAEFVNRNGFKEVIIFVDFDKGGENLKKRLLKALESRGIFPDVDISDKILNICGVNNVESIYDMYIKIKSLKLK